MSEIVINREDILQHRRSVYSKLTSPSYNLEKKISKYSSINQSKENGLFNLVQETFMVQGAVMDNYKSIMPQSQDSYKFCNLVSLYIALKNNLPSLKESDSKDIFNGSDEVDFTKISPNPVDQLLSLYSKAIDELGIKLDLNSITKEFFEWSLLEIENIKDNPIFSKYHSFFKDNPVRIGKKKYESFNNHNYTLPDKLTWEHMGGYENIKEIGKNLVLKIERGFDVGYKKEPVEKGILIYGPPGTGKTFFANIISKQAKAYFEYIQAASYGSPLVNETANKWLALFNRMKSKIETGVEKSIIMFIDEVDFVGKRSDRTDGGKEDNKVITTLNECMDGNSVSGLVFMGATNKVYLLDPALLREGRFSRHIEVGFPDEEARTRIYDVVFRKYEKHALENCDFLTSRGFMEKIDYNALAKISQNLTGADINGVVDRITDKKLVEHLKTGKKILPITMDCAVKEAKKYIDENKIKIMVNLKDYEESRRYLDKYFKR